MDSIIILIAAVLGILGVFALFIKGLKDIIGVNQNRQSFKIGILKIRIRYDHSEFLFFFIKFIYSKQKAMDFLKIHSLQMA